MSIATGESPRPRHHDRFAVILKLALAATIAVTFVVHAVYGPDWELLVGKHYWSRDYYYGGYATRLVKTPEGFRTIQGEGLANITNLLALTVPEARHPRSPYFTGFPGTERLLVPFAASAIVRFTGVSVLTAFWLVNIATWLLTIAAAYLIATLFYSDRYSPLFAALLVAPYPVFTLAFNGVKVSHLGTTFLLLGIYGYETMLRLRPLWLHPIGLSCLMLAGMFASGGWAMLALYVALRQFWISGYRRWVNLAVLLFAVIVARAIVADLTPRYGLPSVEEYLKIDYSVVLAETRQWVAVWLQGGDVSQLKFFNMPGRSVLSMFVPTISTAFVNGHLWTIIIAAVVCWFLRQARMFALMALPLFLLGHSATALTGWTGWHYGYLSAPAATMLFLAIAGGLGALAARQLMAGQLAAVLLVCALLWGFTDQKRHAGLFWGGNPRSYDDHVIVHHEGIDGESVY
jgi:hypothetical protein